MFVAYLISGTTADCNNADKMIDYALSVTCGDSSPEGRAGEWGRPGVSCLSLWERCPSIARTERAILQQKPRLDKSGRGEYPIERRDGTLCGEAVGSQMRELIPV